MPSDGMTARSICFCRRPRHWCCSSGFIEFEDDGLGIIHKAERRVLWDVSALLERILVEPLDVDYHALIDQARAEVNDE
jgi:hypothetical protein